MSLKQAIFEVIKPGFLSTFQDNGRIGYASKGIGRSGAIDDHAYHWGNYLLGNHPTCVSLEISIGQCELIALASTQIITTGADLNFSINDKIAPVWSVISINKSDILRWHKPKTGMRAYLCVLGGFMTKTYFGSRSINIREGLGEAIVVANTLSQNISNNFSKIKRFMPRQFIPDYQKTLTLETYFYFNSLHFTQDNIKDFCTQIQSISSKNDRSAYQLEPQAVKPKNSKMYSEANALGVIQITPNGTPIIMMNDCPTIGGYPKIGIVSKQSLSQLSQRSTKQSVVFKRVELKKMQEDGLKFKDFFTQTID